MKIILLIILVLFTSINYENKKCKCNCGVEERYYYNGKLIKIIYGKNGFLHINNNQIQINADGENINYDSINIAPVKQ